MTPGGGDEVEEYLERLQTLKTKVVNFCNANEIDERRLLLFQGIEFMLDEVEEQRDDQTSGLFSSSAVYFNYSDEFQGKISAYIVQSFEQLTPLTTLIGTSPSVLAGRDDDDADWDDNAQ